MIQVIKANERYQIKGGDWLTGHWHFSFDQYHDPNNMHWGNLRVFNDDFIAPHSGFGKHPHRDMEIVTFVVSGQLTHEDSMGNKGVIRAGEVQRMSAGTGVYHSEYNHSDETVHSLQMWIFPKEKGIEPSYEQRSFTSDQRINRWLPVVSGTQKEEALDINQDVTFYVSSLEEGVSLAHSLDDKPAYLFVIEGELTYGDHTLATGDQVRLDGEANLELKALKKSELILIEV